MTNLSRVTGILFDSRDSGGGGEWLWKNGMSPSPSPQVTDHFSRTPEIYRVK